MRRFILAFRKDFQKLGGGLVSLAKSFEFDERPGMFLSDNFNLNVLIFCATD